MATSGTYTALFDNLDIIREAYDQCSLELRDTHQAETAINSLHILLSEWDNDQVNLWTLSQNTLDLTKGQAEYDLPGEVLDILSAALRRPNGGQFDHTDTMCLRMSMEDYLELPTKEAEGNSVNFMVHRTRTAPKVYLWPTPNDSDLQLRYWAIKQNEDIGTYTNNPAVPKRFIPALTSGLAYKLALKFPAKQKIDEMGRRQFTGQGVDPQRRQELKREYMEAYEKAKDEDRDRASFCVVPKVGGR